MRCKVLSIAACAFLAATAAAIGQQPPAITPVRPLPPYQPAAATIRAHEMLAYARVIETTLDVWKKANDDTERTRAENQLRAAVKGQFIGRCAEHEDEINQLEAKVKKLREHLALRREKQDEIVDFRVQQLLREAQGLGWGTEQPNAGRYGVGLGTEKPPTTVPYPFSPPPQVVYPTPVSVVPGPLTFLDPTTAPLIESAPPKAELPVQASLASSRAQSLNNLKKIGLAMLLYEQAYGYIPPAYSSDKDGKPLLSWRVLILPFLEQEPLYKEFHLDEPWDSDHNKRLIARMPAVYEPQIVRIAGKPFDGDGVGKTNYLTVRGDKTMFPGARSVKVSQIMDGMSNTLMTVEVPTAGAVVWTKPDDFIYDPKDPLKGLVGMWPGEIHVGLGDGSVGALPASIDPTTLNALFTRAGREIVKWNGLNR